MINNNKTSLEEQYEDPEGLGQVEDDLNLKV